ncbi:S-ribosylhomocysteine lyase [[Clostridium] fimetarium]|uniref:S-ribosylhomocysteine lyase n=1 Tax=[Clostridium] fimetarium TaxID=99656 RepID=A0A1I0M5Q9_9FIRM|nr:S-ribosylhomocysteine lyase [[Clostridium] fimetarium]SEV82701.1 S-ribosylhomocysteine lyase [[Clostridium] fimetarium]
MNKIASFTVNHLDLLTGIYVSRKDYIGEEVVTTFDLRFTRPNEEPPMDNPGIHSIEHLGATFLRNHPTWGEKTLYFGPMGCRTGFYVIFSGDLKSEDIVDLLKEMADYILAYEGEIPGYSPRDCGNYLDNNLNLAKIYIKKYKEEVLDNPTAERLNYPN